MVCNRELAVFLEVSELIFLASNPRIWRFILPNSTAPNVFDAKYWFPDAHAYDDLIKIDFVEEIEPTLKVCTHDMIVMEAIG